MSYDTVIIGAGVMGAAAACEVARDGATVALIDQAALPNPRAASIDHSKVFRFAYPDPLYARMAVDSLKLWRRLEADTGRPLLTQTGLLMTGHTEPSFETESLEVLQSLGLEVERLTGYEAARRFPQFNGDAFPYAVFEPSGAILHAERIVNALILLARRRGAEIIEADRVVSIDRGKKSTVIITTASGRAIECGRAMVASGPWTVKLLPDLAGVLNTTRQEVIYFEPRPGTTAPTSKFDVGSFPIFIDLDSGYYGFPVHHSGAMKIANHRKGEAVDPDLRNDAVDGYSIGDCRAFFAQFIPELTSARRIETRVCIYNNTPDDDFIIDWHPGIENVLLVTGFSGHGFKFGSLVGRISAELLLAGRTSWEIERFRLGRFGLS
jgi:monomeric sarcosine oxidase